MPSFAPLEPIPASPGTEEALAAAVAACRPIVIAGGAADWPAVERWTFAALASRFAGRMIPLSSSAASEFAFGAHQAGFVVRKVPFEDAVAAVTASPAAGAPAVRHYLMQLSIGEVLKELAEDLRAPAVVPRSDSVDVAFWMGSPGCVTALHYDVPNNLYVQVRGRKRWRLFSPYQSDRLYGRPLDAKFHYCSRVELLHPDYERFPRLADAHGLECVVGPGDLIYVPPYWWHHVESLDCAVSANFWWPSAVAQCLVPNALRALAVLWRAGNLGQIRTILGCDGHPDSGPGGLLDMAATILATGQAGAAALAAGVVLDERLARDPSPDLLALRWLPALAAGGDEAPVTAAAVAGLIARLCVLARD